MNTIHPLREFAMPTVASSGCGAESIFLSSPRKRRLRNRTQRLGLASGLLLAIACLAWLGWSFDQGWDKYFTGSALTVISLLTLCCAATGVTLMAALPSQPAAAEKAQLEEINARLLKERDLLRTIVDNLPDCIYAKDRQGRFLLNNTAHARSFGAASPEELSGKSDFDFFPRELAEQFFNDEQKIIATGQSVINQEQYKANPAAPAAEKRWSLTSKVIWRDPAGEILGTVGITRDIHELKLTQEALRESEEKLRRSAAQLEQSNRELQDFAYVASHDLQEPLRKIVVFGERLKEKCAATLDAEPRDYIERMQKAAARMQALINDLLAFSRLTTKTHPFVPVPLAKIAGEVVEDLESRIEQVQGRVEVGPLPVIDADALQMRQLLQNLIGNALKFRRAGQAPLVKVAARTYLNQVGQEWCELSVSDNGIGFDEKYLDRIFNVFQRLHARNEYEGTGMGLAIVRKIALHHGGNVTAKSQPGHGATFLVTLPVAQAKNESIHSDK